jgi:type IX secretion system PorP/SprF family membrane protein
VIRFFIISLLLFSEFTIAQDVHYSQFDKTKSLLNPSLIASQNDDYEIQIQRRSQWSSVTVPFNTLSLSFNAKDVYKNLSLGATLLNDKAGDSYFSTNGLSISLVNSFKTNDNLLSIGLQSALYQRSVDYDALIFLENENFTNIKFLFFDIGLGLSNYKIVDQNSALLVGISYFHLNKPKQSLTSNDQVVLSPKYIFHSTYYTSINLDIDISPTIYASSKNQNKEFIIGTGFKYKLNDEFNLISGIYSRINDAFFVTLGIQKAHIEAIISYDINTSTLSSASNFMGGVEFSISYGWSVFKQNKEFNNITCPIYL